MRNPEASVTGNAQSAVPFEDMNEALRQQALNLGYLADEKVMCRADMRGQISFQRCGSCEWTLVAVPSADGQIAYPRLPSRQPIWRRQRTFPKTEGLQAIAYGNGTYVILAKSGAIYTSPNGDTWTKRTVKDPPIFKSITWGADRFVAVGSGSAIFTSPNGADWTPHSLRGFQMLNAVAWGANRFVAVGGGGAILTSTDAADWTEHKSAMTDGINDVVFANNRFVAVGWGGDNSGLPGKVLVSADGAKWKVEQVSDKGALNSVAYGGGVFVAVKYDNAVLLSPDARTWTRQSLGSEDAFSLNRVVWDGDRFIAVGSGHPGCNSYFGVIFSSPDGVKWDSQDLCGWGAVSAVARNGEQLVAVAEDGTVLTSTVREVAGSQGSSESQVAVASHQGSGEGQWALGEGLLEIGDATSSQHANEPMTGVVVEIKTGQASTSLLLDAATAVLKPRAGKDARLRMAFLVDPDPKRLHGVSTGPTQLIGTSIKIGENTHEAFSTMLRMALDFAKPEGGMQLEIAPGSTVKLGLLFPRTKNARSLVLWGKVLPLGEAPPDAAGRSKTLEKTPAHPAAVAFSPQEIERWKSALRSTDLNDKHTALWALGIARESSAVADIDSAFGGDRYELWQGAAWALGNINTPQALRKLIIRAKDPKYGRYVGRALGEFASREATAALLEMLKSSDNDSQGAAALALGRKQERGAVNPLLQLLGKDQVFTALTEEIVGWDARKSRLSADSRSILSGKALRSAALEALVQIGDRGALAPLEARQRRETNGEFKKELGEAIEKLKAAAGKAGGQKR
jgi:hypothetical protein